jgi:acyl carrier protein
MPATITSNQIEQTIVDALNRFGANTAHLTPETTFEQLDVDSLDLVELAAVIEDEFGVTIENSDMAQLRSVGDVVELVVARTS